MSIDDTQQRERFDGKPWRDESLLRRLYVDEGLTDQEIAGRLGCGSHATVGKFRRRFGIERPWKDPDILRELYVGAGLSMYDISDELGCNQSTISRNIRDMEIETRSGNVPEYPVLQDPEQLREMHVAGGMRTGEIADHVGCSPATVTHYLNVHEIERLDLPSAEAVGVLSSAEKLRELYTDGNLTQTEIGNRIGCSQMSVTRALREHEIHIRHDRRAVDSDSPSPSAEYYGPNWTEQRDVALNRDGYGCRRCGCTNKEHVAEYGSALHVHHIEPFASFAPFESMSDYERANSVGNLLTLCCVCHRRLEGVPIDNRRGDKSTS